MEFVYVYLPPVSEAVGGCILRRHGIDLLLMERQNFLPVQGSFIFEVEMVRLEAVCNALMTLWRRSEVEI